MKKINVLNSGLALGSAFGLFFLLLGIVSWLTGLWAEFVTSVGKFVYFGYAPTFLGSIIGTIWAFFDFFIGGVIIAWFYNFFQEKRR